MKIKVLLILCSFIVFQSCIVDSIDPIEDKVHSITIVENETWCSDKIHVVEGQLVVKNAVLTICEGTTVKFKEGASLIIDEGAALHCGFNHPKALTVFFTGENAEAGFWDKIEFREGSLDDESYIYYTVLQYGGSVDEMINIASDVKIQNILLTHSGSSGIKIEKNAFPELDSIAISYCFDYPIEAYFGNAHILNSTILFQGNLNEYAILNEGTINQNVNWKKLDIPYIINGNSNIVNNGQWIIDPGVEILMNENAAVIVKEGGSIYAVGSGSKIIVSSVVKQKGYWKNIEFREDADHENCIIGNCTIEFGGSDLALINLQGSSPTIKNCILQHSSSCGIFKNAASVPILEENTFIDNDGDDICE